MIKDISVKCRRLITALRLHQKVSLRLGKAHPHVCNSLSNGQGEILATVRESVQMRKQSDTPLTTGDLGKGYRCALCCPCNFPISEIISK